MNLPFFLSFWQLLYWRRVSIVLFTILDSCTVSASQLTKFPLILINSWGCFTSFLECRCDVRRAHTPSIEPLVGLLSPCSSSPIDYKNEWLSWLRNPSTRMSVVLKSGPDWVCTAHVTGGCCHDFNSTHMAGNGDTARVSWIFEQSCWRRTTWLQEYRNSPPQWVMLFQWEVSRRVMPVRDITDPCPRIRIRPYTHCHDGLQSAGIALLDQIAFNSSIKSNQISSI